MSLIPKVMSTQHPDNASPAPFADTSGVLRGDGEIEEAVDVFALGCDEQMWDSEGKEADNQVVRKLLTGYPDFFQDGIRLGADVALTLRVPNPRVERDMRKSMVEALQSVSSSWDMAQGFYGDGDVAPIQEVILPLTTSAEELSMVEAYYRKVIVGQEDQTILGGQSVKDWVGEFYPKSVRVIPLIEDMENLFYCDRIVEEYLRDRDLPYQRVFLARSDPALNYGMVAAELILKVGLLRLHNLEAKLGLPLYPIIGAGSAPFRGHLGPTNVERSLAEYPSAQTFTVQSAFKYDYDRDTVKDGIAEDTRARAYRSHVHRPGQGEGDHRQVHRGVPGAGAGPDRRHHNGVGSCPQATRAQDARRTVRLRALSRRSGWSHASQGHRIRGVAVLHRRSSRTAGTCLPGRERS